VVEEVLVAGGDAKDFAGDAPEEYSDLACHDLMMQPCRRAKIDCRQAV